MKIKSLLRSLFIVVTVLFATVGSGCKATLAPAGAYQGDTVLYEADNTIVNAYDILHTFVSWEYQNRAALASRPEITKAADVVRLNAQRYITSAIALRDAYAKSPTKENRSALTTSISVLKTALIEAQGYMTKTQSK